MEERFVLGIDFGTLSARCTLVDVASGAEVAWSEHKYPHGVIDEVLPGTDVVLPGGAVRQHPGDYLTALQAVVRSVMEKSDVQPEQIAALGIDFTSCTIVPLNQSNTPLCLEPEFRSEPDAWVHLWKDQSAQPEADELTARARQQNEAFLTWSGNKIAADTLYPKVLQIARRSPNVFHAATRFAEAGDWIAQFLTGQTVGGVSAAGYKALWDQNYPVEFLKDVDPSLEQLAQEKLVTNLSVPGESVGTLTAQAAQFLGLVPGITVASPNIDAHASLSGSGVSRPGTMVLVMGTSICHMLLSDDLVAVPGIVGAIRDGIIPGYIGYEAGQPACGDLFAWFIEHALPGQYVEAAEKMGLSSYDYLERLGEELVPGETGMLALDWWNGNRSPLANANLSGLIIGYTLKTRPEHIFRTLLESVAFGTRAIIDNFESHGIAVDAIRACGGVAYNSSFMMQLLADITGRRISLAAVPQASALGSAVMAAAATGHGQVAERVQQAIGRMVQGPTTVYEPRAKNKAVYDELYGLYQTLVAQHAQSGGVIESLVSIRARQQMKRSENVSLSS